MKKRYNQKITILPVYNEQKTIYSILEKLTNISDFIILVDDFSTDKSVKLIKDFIKTSKKNHIYLVQLNKNKGMATALKYGLLQAYKLLIKGFIDPEDIIITMDADGQHTTHFFNKITKTLINKNLDYIQPFRNFTYYPYYKIIGNKGLTAFANYFANRNYLDSECGFRTFKVKWLEKILLYYTGFRYSCAQEIAIILGNCPSKILSCFFIDVPFYVKGASAMYGPSNIFFGFISYIRYKLNIKNNLPKMLKKLDKFIT